MSIISSIRLVLACVLFILAGFIASASSTDPGNDLRNDAGDKKYEYQKKAIYYEIRAELVAGDITLEEAQRKWQKAIKKLEKKEGK